MDVWDYYNQAASVLKKGTFNTVVVHDLDHFNNYFSDALDGVDVHLVLSGHTHGGLPLAMTWLMMHGGYRNFNDQSNGIEYLANPNGNPAVSFMIPGSDPPLARVNVPPYVWNYFGGKAPGFGIVEISGPSE